MRDEFGVEWVALTWIESYLSGRSQFVGIGEQSSTMSKLESGVTQGSVLGPLLFASYVSPVGDVIQKDGLKHHQYADDTQLYLRKIDSLSSGSEANRKMHTGGWRLVSGQRFTTQPVKVGGNVTRDRCTASDRHRRRICCGCRGTVAIRR